MAFPGEPMDKAPFIPFNMPVRTGREAGHISAVLERQCLTASHYHNACRDWLANRFARAGMLLTPSCTHALEMAALLLNLRPGDEIIMPSFTFVSTANAFAMHGATPVFVDIRPDTMNIDETLVEAAITPRTRAIIAMHYAGVACDMDTLGAIAARHGIPLVEDAAHAMFARWKGRDLGTIGAIGAFSFHETKNLTSGEGGCIILNDESYAERADIMQHKGTNRTAFRLKKTNKYEWMDTGSSWKLGELASAYLWGNIEEANAIMARRMQLWRRYREALAPLEQAGVANLPVIPQACEHNATIFYLKLEDTTARDRFLAAMRAQEIECTFHYVPLHSSPAGQRLGRFHGEDRHTTKESGRLVRLPLYYNLSDEECLRVIDAVLAYSLGITSGGKDMSSSLLKQHSPR